MGADPKLDPVTLAVLRGRLEQIADEMDATLYRSAFNPIIAEAHDACHGLYDAQTGDTLIQGKSGLPVFVGAMAFAVRAAMKAASERGGMQSGDVWLYTDRAANLGPGIESVRRLLNERAVRPSQEFFCENGSFGYAGRTGVSQP